MVPWHNPVLVAEQVATLDLERRRVDFGVGKGYRQASSTLLHSRVEATELRRAMEIIRKWTSGRFSHHCKRWHYDDVVVEPEPPQRPHPPLWLAAGSDSIRCAAREVNLLLDQLAQVDQIIRRIAVFRENARRIAAPIIPPWSRPPALQMIHSERAGCAWETRRVVSVIGDLPRDSCPTASRTIPRRWSVPPSDRPAEELEAGGATNILLVDPNASVGNLRASPARSCRASGWPAPLPPNDGSPVGRPRRRDRRLAGRRLCRAPVRRFRRRGVIPEPAGGDPTVPFRR